jgi:very-short-patch-repair endonuclease
MTKVHNRKYLLDRRRELRQNLTPAEATMWSLMKGKKLGGRKFRRQHSIGNFIVDFYCPSEKLAIELDGDGHFTSAGWEQDQRKEKYLNESGIKVIRFENDEVFLATEAVVEEIKRNFMKD